jgi:lysophospholipase L1-like esterase
MKPKKLFASAIALTMLFTCLTGCSDKAETSSQSSEAAADSEDVSSAEEKLPETDEEWHQAMIDKSLTSYGNVSKMQEKLKAAQSGEQVNISYLGGSITEGLTAGADKCWAKLTYDYIADKFGTGDNVTYNNAGLSGTPSTLGVIRLSRDVLAYDPDICFVEYAVNDGNEGDYQSAYESIIRTLIENDVAVVLVFARTEDGHTCQEYMQAQGEYYDLPMISYSDAITYMFDNDQMTWQDFSDDQSHPNEYGHTLVAEMVENYFDGVMDRTAEDYVYPEEPMTEIRQYGAQLYENTSLTPTDMGSWEEGSEIASFTNGWNHPRDGENEPIKFEFSGKFVYLLYHEVSQGLLGKAHIKITCDGELYDEFDLDPISSDGWGNCETKCIAMSAKTADYEIEISMAEGDEDKYFAVLGFGYTS